MADKRLITIETVIELLSPDEMEFWGDLPKKERAIIARIVVKSVKAQAKLTLQEVGEWLDYFPGYYRDTNAKWKRTLWVCTHRVVTAEFIEALKQGEIAEMTALTIAEANKT